MGAGRIARTCALAAAAALGVLEPCAWAQTDADNGALFASATTALHEGRPGDAIAELEALADRGLLDPVASYDRGLAYADRVRVGAEVPGDLGRAAQAFEEARELSRDPKLVDDATKALTVVRGEIARRRLRAGQPVEMVDAGRSFGRAIASLLREDVWTALCAVASIALALGLLVRWIAPPARARVAGGLAAAVATPVLAVAIAMTLAARHDRLTLREGVIVTPTARPIDERGVSIPGGTSLPEGARVEIIDQRSGATRVRFGGGDVWLAATGVREIARL
jgi:hypothetical protein